jgi:hypothetical protein
MPRLASMMTVRCSPIAEKASLNDGTTCRQEIAGPRCARVPVHNAAEITTLTRRAVRPRGLGFHRQYRAWSAAYHLRVVRDVPIRLERVHYWPCVSNDRRVLSHRRYHSGVAAGRAGASAA